MSSLSTLRSSSSLRTRPDLRLPSPRLLRIRIPLIPQPLLLTLPAIALENYLPSETQCLQVLTRLITPRGLLQLLGKVVEIRLRLLSPRQRLLLQLRAISLGHMSSLRLMLMLWRCRCIPEISLPVSA
jgi:hypothetical protein